MENHIRKPLTKNEIEMLKESGIDCDDCRSAYRCGVYLDRYGELCPEFIKVDCSLCVHRLHADGDTCLNMNIGQFGCGYQRDKDEKPADIEEYTGEECCHDCRYCDGCDKKKWVRYACNSFIKAECEDCAYWQPSLYECMDGAYTCRLSESNRPISYNSCINGCGFLAKTGGDNE